MDIVLVCTNTATIIKSVESTYSVLNTGSYLLYYFCQVCSVYCTVIYWALLYYISSLKSA